MSVHERGRENREKTGWKEREREESVLEEQEVQSHKGTSWREKEGVEWVSDGVQQPGRAQLFFDPLTYASLFQLPTLCGPETASCSLVFVEVLLSVDLRFYHFGYPLINIFFFFSLWFLSTWRFSKGGKKKEKIKYEQGEIKKTFYLLETMNRLCNVSRLFAMWQW